MQHVMLLASFATGSYIQHALDCYYLKGISLNERLPRKWHPRPFPRNSNTFYRVDEHALVTLREERWIRACLHAAVPVPVWK